MVIGQAGTKLKSTAAAAKSDAGCQRASRAAAKRVHALVLLVWTAQSWGPVVRMETQKPSAAGAGETWERLRWAKRTTSLGAGLVRAARCAATPRRIMQHRKLRRCFMGPLGSGRGIHARVRHVRRCLSKAQSLPKEHAFALEPRAGLWQ